MFITDQNSRWQIKSLQELAGNPSERSSPGVTQVQVGTGKGSLSPRGHLLLHFQPVLAR